jgi:flagellar basal-body rod protein FlgB
MPISEFPILSMLRTRMQWQQERQRVLAENVANADTPNFRPRDLTEPQFDRMTGPLTTVALARTNTGHIAGSAADGARFATSRGGSEIRPAGNAVSLEDEMMKVAANQMDFQQAASLYGRSLNLLKTALGKK